MLVLTRRPNEGVHVGADVRVVVLEVSGDQVRLGFEAPSRTRVLRDEVFARVAGANSEAALHARAGEGPALLEGERD